MTQQPPVTKEYAAMIDDAMKRPIFGKWYIVPEPPAEERLVRLAMECLYAIHGPNPENVKRRQFEAEELAVGMQWLMSRPHATRILVDEVVVWEREELWPRDSDGELHCCCPTGPDTRWVCDACKGEANG